MRDLSGDSKRVSIDFLFWKEEVAHYVLPTQSMNLKKVLKKVMYACMSAAMIAVPTVPAYAAQNDVIDTTRTASLTIHKYDMTAAKKRVELT